MEKKSSVNDIHSLINKDRVRLYKSLNDKLGDQNPFAKFSIGGGFYVWSDAKCQWSQMISAPEQKQNFVRHALMQTRKSISSILGEKSAELLFTVPDDSYIYYNDDADDIRILITGWGFMKPVRISGGSDVDELEMKVPVSISFSIDGRKLPEYEFGLQLPKQLKKEATDSEGLYYFDDLNEGRHLVIVDLNTNRKFDLVVSKGRTHYDFDLSSMCNVTCKVCAGGKPVCGEIARLIYGGRVFELTTDELGQAVVELSYSPKEEIQVTLRDQVKQDCIKAEGNVFLFDFEEPELPVRTDIVVSAFIDTLPLENKEVCISYGGKEYKGVTDSNGSYTQNVEVLPEQKCEVSVSGFIPEAKVLKREEVNEFVFSETSRSFEPCVIVRNSDEQPVGSYPVVVEYNGHVSDFVTDDNGCVKLQEMTEGRRMKVTDGKHPDNFSIYELKYNEPEYVFYVPDPEPDQEPMIKATFVEPDDSPILCDKVRFCEMETGREYSGIPDEHGSIEFPQVALPVDKVITAEIIESGKDTIRVDFTLDEGESEYVFQRKQEKFKWWRVMLHILAVIAAIAFLIILWVFLEQFSVYIFDLIHK